MSDGRVRPKMSPPSGRVGRTIQVHLSASDYRKLYELTLRRGVSMAETVRQIVREASCES